jgi:hypothetical protein
MVDMSGEKKVLLICGSLNQTIQMHKIAQALPYDCYFTEYFTTGFYYWAQRRGLLNFTSILGDRQLRIVRDYIRDSNLPIDYRGEQRRYDLVLTCTDLIMPNNLRGAPVILIQEGITDPETPMFHLVKAFRKMGFPRWLARTSTTGLSDAYEKFCVASDGYKDLFVRKGVRQEKIVVTGIPNFDNVKEYLDNDFPYKHFVMVASSDLRENFAWDNRRRFIRRAREIAKGKQLIFKLHPNERWKRCHDEIMFEAPGSIVIQKGNPHHMIANCDVLVTQYSTLAFTGLALGKEVHSYFNVDELKVLTPIQNGGTSNEKIASVCHQLLSKKLVRRNQGGMA